MRRTVDFLVRGECSCGWWMAAPGGAAWPLCPECGEQVMPPRPIPECADPELRANGREGYVAVLMPEQEAFQTVRRVVRTLRVTS